MVFCKSFCVLLVRIRCKSVFVVVSKLFYSILTNERFKLDQLFPLLKKGCVNVCLLGVKVHLFNLRFVL